MYVSRPTAHPHSPWLLLCHKQYYLLPAEAALARFPSPRGSAPSHPSSLLTWQVPGGLAISSFTLVHARARKIFANTFLPAFNCNSSKGDRSVVRTQPKETPLSNFLMVCVGSKLWGQIAIAWLFALVCLAEYVLAFSSVTGGSAIF